MECERCRGAMISDRFMDVYEDLSMRQFIGWRCINCGEVSDPTIEANRLDQLRQERQAVGRQRRKTLKKVISTR